MTAPVRDSFSILPAELKGQIAHFFGGHGISHLNQLSKQFHQAAKHLFCNRYDLLSSLLMKRRLDLSELSVHETHALQAYGGSCRVLRFIDHENEKVEISREVAEAVSKYFPGLKELHGKIRSVDVLEVLEPFAGKLLHLDLECEVQIPFLRNCSELRVLELQRTPMSNVMGAVRACTHLHTLHLSKCLDLTARMVQKIATTLPDLTSLQLISREVDDPDQCFQETAHFKRLESLKLIVGKILHLPRAVASIQKLQALKKLSLNFASGVTSADLRQLQLLPLTDLTVSFRAKTPARVLEEFFSSLSRLQSCTVAEASPRQLPALAKCPALTELTFGSQVAFNEESDFTWLERLQSLEKLTFRWNTKVGTALFHALRKMPHLHSLILECVALQSTGWGQLEVIPHLQHLELAYIQGDSKETVQLLGFMPLTSLYVSGQHVDDVFLAALQQKQTLRKLRVTFTESPIPKCTPQAIRGLSALKQLETLELERLYHTSEPAETMKYLREQLPHTRIVELL